MICYLIFLETLRQRIMLRIMLRFCTFLKMTRRKRNFDIYYIRGNDAFSCTIPIRMKRLTTGQFSRTFTLINFQGIDFTLKSSLRCFLLATTHVFYTRVLQFKNAFSLSKNCGCFQKCLEVQKLL